ncbi:MAG: dockerin type I domain-containing protein [Saprospiraceae bacterium]
MKSRVNIFVVFLTAVITLLSAYGFRYSGQAAMMPVVFAGNNRVMCLNQNLLLSDLKATISGDGVDDGDWIPIGDGRFQPGNLEKVRYLDAERSQVTYVPGTLDKSLGFYRLMLMCDVPQNSKAQREWAEIKITFQQAPPLFCSTNLNISLDETCSQIISVNMLQPNPTPPFANYIITLYDASGKIIPDNIINKNHVDKEITYRLGHQCTSNICWGKFKVEDYFPPVFQCENKRINCLQSFAPDSVGFPFPLGAKIDTIINGRYIISNWDACSNVTLEYTDETVKANCVGSLDKTITRRWKATDAKGNMSTCNQIIEIAKIPLSSVTIPRHYDGHDLPAFECGDTFPMLPNGHPSPDTTGRPNVGLCGNLQFTMTDVRFDLCGKGFKIARSWFVIDWCTSESFTRNQIIVVTDSKGPVITCRDTVRLFTGAYLCSINQTAMPLLLMSSDCNTFSVGYELTEKSGAIVNHFLNTVQQNVFLTGLPVGTFHLNYTATDICGNTSKCRSVITVADNIAPFAVCDQTTKVSLDGSGKGRVFAATFDDGSTDNCGIAHFKVRRMTDECGFGIDFGDYVEFCCTDIGKTHMVALQVTDIYGNRNTCMVEVIVEDKLPPVISCPPNLTLECTQNYDFNNLNIYGTVVTDPSKVKNIIVNNRYHNGVVGKDGLALDNCSVSVSQSYVADIKCFTGTIKRKFIATDPLGRKDSCTQIITILNPRPFSVDDITWPKYFDSTGCRANQADPTVTGTPTFTFTDCANVTSTYEDQKFFIADGACVKIIRTWTVVDWCQFKDIQSPGKWSAIQVIKLHNTDRPFFTAPCKDTSFCSFDLDCKIGEVYLVQTAKDSCTDTKDLIWSYQLDLHQNGKIDSVGSINEYFGQVPLGKHKITWRVDDQCGNFSTCTQLFTVSDCKKPTPYCISSLTITLMSPSADNEVWAKDFDLGSFDNCTPKNELIFTFNAASPVDTLRNKLHYFKNNGQNATKIEYQQGMAQKWVPEQKSSSLYFDCKNIPDGKAAVVNLSMTVRDSAGLSDACQVTLLLQDNSNVCPDLITDGSISGRIVTEDNKIAVGTQVQYFGGEKSGNQLIDPAVGSFVINGMPLYHDYSLTPVLNSDPMAGVSTIDLVMIQRHLLGLAPFDSPYKMIAADVNGSKSVSAADLVELRKLILGMIDKFPKDQDSWTFVVKNGGIANPSNPWEYKKSLKTGILNSDISSMDFVAVKMGDVNNSVFNVADPEVTNRSRQSDEYQVLTGIEIINERPYLIFRASADIEADGYQMYYNLDRSDLYLSDHPLETSVANSNITTHIYSGGLNLVNYFATSHRFAKNDLLAAYPWQGSDELALSLNQKFSSEIYVNNKARPIRLIQKSESTYIAGEISLMTNPVLDHIQLMMSEDLKVGDYHWTIFNARGEGVVSSTFRHDLSSFEHSIYLSNDIPPGMYHMHIIGAKTAHTLRFLRIH